MKLNTEKIYDLRELSEEQRAEIEKSTGTKVYNYRYLVHSNNGWFVCSDGSKFITIPYNAKELFYTLENVQVDCIDLSEDKIEEMANVFFEAGYKYYNKNKTYALKPMYDNYFLYLEDDNEILLCTGDEDKQTITYEKFMELFGENKSGWYKTNISTSKKWLMYIDVDNNIQYGFDSNGDFTRNNYNVHICSEDYLATTEEVTERLIEEAKRIGFENGVFKFDNNELFNNWNSIMKYGVWSEVIEEKINIEVDLNVIPLNPQNHYNNENGSLYKLAEELGLNHWEFDILKRLVRCREKGQFEQDLQKIKDTTDIYLREYNYEK